MHRTLFVGLGGLGMRVVSKLKIQQADTSNQESRYVVLDRDNYDLHNCAKKDGIPFVSMGINQPIRNYLTLLQPNHNIEEWFPTTPALLHSVVENIGMIRPAGRLAFLGAMEMGQLDGIVDIIKEMVKSGNPNDTLQVVVITSLAGGTGSGSFIQVALWIKHQFVKLGFANYRIDGLFAGPEVFINSFRCVENSPEECEVLRGNTYAALKELDVISKLEQGVLAQSLSDTIHLDGLLNNPLCQRGNTSVFDKIYIYDSPKNTDDIEESLEEHISNIASLLRTNFPSVATDIGLQIEQYLNSAAVLKPAYLRMCNRAKQLALSYYNPHIDKRWIDLLNNP